jgi:hypothetical protein
MRAPSTPALAMPASGNTSASRTPPWPPTGAYGESISQLTADDRLPRRGATQLAEQALEVSG